MAKRVGGSRRKARHKLRKKKSKRGKFSIKKYLQEFKEGDRVILKAEPAYQKGMYHARFHGKIGSINKKKGKCYEVSMKDQTKAKLLIVHPIHLKKV